MFGNVFYYFFICINEHYGKGAQIISDGHCGQYYGTLVKTNFLWHD